MITNRIAKAEDIIWRRIGDDIVVIKDDGQSTHVLNKTAALIWEMCDGNSGIDEIAAKLCERYEVSLDVARADTEEIIDTLTQSGIIINKEN